MKLFTLALLALSARAASIGIDIPIHSILHMKQAYHESRGDKWGMISSTLAVQAVNAADVLTTYRGPILHPGQYCEDNPIFTPTPCVVDVARFTGAKIAVAAFNLAEWVPVWTHKGGERYMRAVTVINYVGIAPIAGAVANNIVQLTK